MVWGIALILAGLGSTAGEIGGGLRRFEAVETHMGSPFKLLFYTDDEAAASRARLAAFARIAALDKILSDYDPETELMRLCDRAGGSPVAVSDDLFEVLKRSYDMAERSGGAFDPTIAPVVRLWRRARRERKLPDAEAIRKARERVGYRKMTLDPTSKTVRLEAGVKLDLGGIAKGYASQEALKSILALGIGRCLVAGAGDIAVGDPPPGESGWTVAVASIDEPGTNPPERTLRLRNCAVSTSGDAERFVEIGGVRYSHIVDPTTGIGMTTRTSVTVVAPDGGTADALDTAACLLGPEKGLTLVGATKGAEIFFVRKVGVTIERFESAGFRTLLDPGGRIGP